MIVIGKGFDPLVDFFGSQITSAKDRIHFIGCDHIFVLGWDLRAPLGNVKIAEDEGELTHLLLFSHRLLIDG